MCNFSIEFQIRRVDNKLKLKDYRLFLCNRAVCLAKVQLGMENVRGECDIDLRKQEIVVDTEPTTTCPTLS